MSFMAITEQPRRDATHKTTSAPKIFRAADGAILPPTVHALACLSRKPVNRPICAFSEHSVSPESRQILFLLSESQEFLASFLTVPCRSVYDHPHIIEVANAS